MKKNSNRALDVKLPGLPSPSAVNCMKRVQQETILNIVFLGIVLAKKCLSPLRIKPGW